MPGLRLSSRLLLKPAALDNSGGVVNAGGVLTVRSGALNNQTGTLASGSAVAITSQALNNAQGQISAQQTISKTGSTGNVQVDTGGQSLDNSQGLIVSANLLTVTTGAVRNTKGQIGALGSSSQASLSIGDLDNTNGLISARTLGLTSTGAVTNAGGSLSAAQDLILIAQSVANTADASGTVAGQISAGRDLWLTARASLINHAASVQSGRNAMLRLGTLTNDGGVLDSHGTLDVSVTDAASNRGGVIRTANAAGASSAGALTLTAADFDNSAGTVNAATLLSITTGQLTNANAGLLQASGGTLTLTARQVSNRSGAIVGAGDLSASTGAFDNTAGTISSTSNLWLDTHSNALMNAADGTHNASIQAGGTATLTTGTLTNAANGSTTAVIAAQHLSVIASSVVNAGTLAAGGTNAVDGSLAITTSGALANDGGRIQAQGLVTTNSLRLSNQAGKIVAASASDSTAPVLQVTTNGTLDNSNHGLIAALDGDTTLSTQGGALKNSAAGVIYAKGALGLATGTLDNSSGGGLQSGGALSATTLALNNTAGLIQGGSVF